MRKRLVISIICAIALIMFSAIMCATSKSLDVDGEDNGTHLYVAEYPTEETATEEELSISINTEITSESSIGSLDWGAEDSYLLAKIAMAEAEGEDTESKALVMLVVLNRVWSDKFPNTIADVIFQEVDGVYQFTPIGNGRWDAVEPDEDCWKALNLIYSGWDESQGALYFELSMEGTWQSRNLEFLFEHESISFYTERGECR